MSQNKATATAFPVIGTNLFRFRKAGEAKSVDHYNNIRLTIRESLRVAVKAIDPDPDDSFSIRPVLIGRDEATATLHLVVFCSPRYEETVKHFFTTDLARSLLCLPQYTYPLEYIVLRDPPHATLGVDVCSQKSYGSTYGTLYGASITLRSSEGCQTAMPIRQATFGGTIKAVYDSGEKRFYGVVAGHLVENFQQQSTISLSRSMVNKVGDLGPTNLAIWTHDSYILGKPLDSHNLPGVASNLVKPTHDWALVVLESPLSNRALHVGCSGGKSVNDIESHAIFVAEKPRFLDETSDSVLLLGAAGGTRRGELSDPTAQIWLAHSDCFVESYILELEEDTVREGDSRATDLNSSGGERRLIYIQHPDRDYLLAIVKTLSLSESEALRVAINYFVSGECRIQVTLPSTGVTFKLEFHIPYLILRTSENLDSKCSSATFNCEHWADLSFLNMSPDTSKHRDFNIYEAHISIVICGWNHTNWTGWAFAKTDFAVEEREEEEDDETWFNFEECEEKEDEDTMAEDYFASDGVGETLDANVPIWDPRYYFLRILAIRLDIVLREWRYLVQTIEYSIEHPHGLDTFLTSHMLKVDVQKGLDRVTHTIDLSSRLRQNLSHSMRAWDLYSDPDGDACYFSDMNTRDVLKLMHNIKESFQGLRGLEQKLNTITEFCETSSKILALRLVHHNTVLGFDGNQLRWESNELGRRAHELHLRTNIISHDIHDLNRSGTEAAISSMKAAEMTSKTTRINVLIILLVTPLVLVLQYFGAERDIFAFERSPKSFIVALIILMFALPIMTILLNRVEGVVHYVRCKAGSKRVNNTQGGDREKGLLDLELQPAFSKVVAN